MEPWCGLQRKIELTEAIRQGDCSPIPFEEFMDVSEATIAIASGGAISLRTTQIPAEKKTADESDSQNHESFDHCRGSILIRNLGL